MSILKTYFSRLALAAALGVSMLGMSLSATAAPPIQPPLPPVPAPIPAPPTPAPGPGNTGEIPCKPPVNPAQNLAFHKRDWPLTGGLHMDTRGTVNRSIGKVDATVHIYNSYWGMGYTGSMMMLLRDHCGTLIGVTQPDKWGVEAKLWFWNTNERKEHYVANVDPRITSRVASVEVIHNRYTTGANMSAAYNAAREIACLNLKLVLPFPGECPIPRLK